MSYIFSIITLRSVLVFASTAFSLLLVMLALNIVTVDEVAIILKLSPEATMAFKVMVSRIQEVTGNLMDIISQLLNKLLNWAGVDINLRRIHVDTNAITAPLSNGLDAATTPAPAAPANQ